MTVITQKYVRKSFPVDAIQVTSTNMEDIAEWCGGEIRYEDSSRPDGDKIKYVHVRVYRPMSDEQTKARVGNWVLYAGTGYKVYTDKAFKQCFQQEGESPKPTAPPIQATTEPAVDGLESDAAIQAAKEQPVMVSKQ